MHKGYLILGWCCVGLGTLGIFLPLLPTTVFLLIAAWAFARSDERCHRWLLSHPHFGPMIECWQRHRAMPRRAKIAAFIALAASYTFTAWVFGPLSMASIIAGTCIAAVALYISHIPILSKEQEDALRRS